jgi:hypothetical protein
MANCIRSVPVPSQKGGWVVVARRAPAGRAARRGSSQLLYLERAADGVPRTRRPHLGRSGRVAYLGAGYRASALARQKNGASTQLGGSFLSVQSMIAVETVSRQRDITWCFSI